MQFFFLSFPPTWTASLTLVNMVSQKTRTYCKLAIAIFVLLVIDLSWEHWNSPHIDNISIIQAKSDNGPTPNRIIRLGDFYNSRLINSSTTIVTSLFKLNESKYSLESDHEDDVIRCQRLEAMLKSLAVPFVAFVDAHTAEWFQKVFSSQKNIQPHLIGILFVSANIWNVADELESVRNRSYSNEYSSSELYAMRNLRPFMLRRVSKVNPFRSEIFMYVESDSWRSGKVFDRWPNVEFTRVIAMQIKSRILFAQIHPQTNETRLFNQPIIQDGFFVGTTMSIRRFYVEFYNLHDLLIRQARFSLDRKQHLINFFVFERTYQDQVVILRAFDLNCYERVDRRAFFQYYFAAQNEYTCLNERLPLLIF